MMKIVRIPLKKYKAMTVWPFIFVDKNARMDATTLHHEEIHGKQQVEMLIVFFLLWYVLEWLIRLIVYRNAHKAYRMIGFEQEAYLNELDGDYKRKHYAWLKYLF